MTATLVAKDVAGGYAHRVLFDHLDLTVTPGDVVGVVGANGAGKTTLLRVLAGDLAPLEGTVTRAPADAFVGWLPQEHARVTGETVGAYVARRTGCAAATAAMDAAAAALADPPDGAHPDDLADVYSAALDHWLATGAPDLDERLAATLVDLGLETGTPAPESALMTDLSGGQAARVGLAALLCSRFDVVLLDEPTNDLDLDGLARLEEVVQGMRGGVVLVSHDREFLSRSVTRVLELDLAQHTNTVFGGGYDSFLEEREVARRHRREEYEEFAERKADLVARARTQREWSSQGVRNAIRKAPDSDKHRRRAASESSEKQAQKVRQMESRIARLEEVVEPRKEWVLEFTIGSAPRSSSVVSTLSDAVVRRGDFVLGPVSLQVNAGERIGITGPNGAGKSTLLRLLFGDLEPDSGDARLSANVAIGEGDRPVASALHRSAAARRALRGVRPRLHQRRGPHPAREVRVTRRPRQPAGERAVAGGAHQGGVGVAASPRHQCPGARRADQSPRPCRDRTTGIGTRLLRRCTAAGDTRPSDAGQCARRPALARRGRARHRAVRSSPYL